LEEGTLKAKKRILLGAGIVILAIIAVVGIIQVGKAKKEKELKQNFEIQNMVGRWVDEGGEFAFLVYTDTNESDLYHIRTDLLYDSEGECLQGKCVSIETILAILRL